MTDISFEEIYKESKLPDTLQEAWEMLSCLAYTEDKRIFLIKNKSDGKRYILKWRKSGTEASGRLRNEYELLKKINEPFIPNPVSLSEDKTGIYLIKEFIPGKTLKQIIDGHGNMLLREASEAILKVCMMVRRLHEYDPPLVHRDIKPENIISKETGEFVFIDLDTMREYHKNETSDTVYLGTAETAAPEQFGFMQSSIRTDIYSLGKLYLYLLTGKYTVYCPEWEELPKAYQNIINKCLAFDPQHRYASVSSLMADISCAGKFGIRRVTRNIIALAAIIFIAMISFVTMKGIKDKRYRTLSVQFANPQIEQAARNALGKEADEIITPEELSRITSLILCGDKTFGSWQEHEDYHSNYFAEFGDTVLKIEPADLSDLKLFPQLHTLALDNQGVEDLSFIKELPLTRLSLRRDQLENLDGIGEMTTLQSINLFQNPLTDISDLRALQNLTELNVEDTPLSDIEPVRSLNLNSLNIGNSAVEDISFISKMNDLSSLTVSQIDEDDLLVINSLGHLEHILILEGMIPSLYDLSGLKRLESLDLYKINGLDSLDGIESFPRLNYLGIAYCNVSDLSKLVECALLESADIRGIPAKDLSPLKDCGRLSMLYISPDMEALVSGLNLDDRVQVLVFD